VGPPSLIESWWKEKADQGGGGGWGKSFVLLQESPKEWRWTCHEQGVGEGTQCKV